MNNRNRRALLASGIALLAGTPAPAQNTAEPQRGEILVWGRQENPLTLPTSTASRLGITALQTPASVATLDGDVILARGDVSVVDAVTRAPGITSVANPGNGGTALAARGFSGQGSVLQLVDGIRLFPVAGTITFPTDPWNVARIEVLNGPASVLYGQGALGGAINVLTKQPTPDQTVIDGQASYGSQNAWHVAAGAGGPLGEVLSYRVDASYRRSDGYVDRGRSKSLALSGALRFAPAETVSLTLRHDHGDQRPLEYFGTPLIGGVLLDANQRRNYNVADASLHYRDDRTTLTAEWRPSEAVTIGNAAYRLASNRLFRNLEGYDGSSGRVDRFDNLAIRHDQVQYGNQGTVRISAPLGGSATNDLVAGFDVNFIKLTYSNDFGALGQEDTVDPFVFAPGSYLQLQTFLPRYKTRTREYSLFAENRLKLNERLSIVGGVRAEWDRVERRNIVYAVDGTTTEVNAFPGGRTQRKLDNVTWRVGAVYQPVPTVSLYGQYSTGVDPLGTLTTFSTNATQFFFTNATGDQIESGIKASFLDGRGAATLAAYRIVKKNLVAQRTPTSPVEQIGRRSARGIEASLTLDLPAGFGIDANGTILDADYDDFISGGTRFTGNTPPNIAETSANLWLRWDATSMVQARAGLRYVGRTFSDNANMFRVPGYAVVDGGVSYAVTPALSLDLRVYNLLNKDYAITTYNDEQWILGRPRSLDASLRARF